MTNQFNPYGHWEATPESLVEITNPEYYRKGWVEDNLVYQWCREQQIFARRQQTGVGPDVWSIPDHQHRVLFALRWS